MEFMKGFIILVGFILACLIAPAIWPFLLIGGVIWFLVWLISSSSNSTSLPLKDKNTVKGKSLSVKENLDKLNNYKEPVKTYSDTTGWKL